MSSCLPLAGFGSKTKGKGRRLVFVKQGREASWEKKKVRWPRVCFWVRRGGERLQDRWGAAGWVETDFRVRFFMCFSLNVQNCPPLVCCGDQYL